jgi:hypothetical protein
MMAEMHMMLAYERPLFVFWELGKVTGGWGGLLLDPYPESHCVPFHFHFQLFVKHKFCE